MRSFWPSPLRSCARVALVAMCALFSLTGCGGDAIPAAQTGLSGTKNASQGSGDAGFAALDMHIIGSLAHAEETIVSARGEKSIVLAFPSQSGWMIASLDAHGAPQAAPQKVKLKGDVRRAAIAAIPGGFAAVFEKHVDRNRAYSLVVMDSRGIIRRGPELLTQLSRDIDWFELQPTKRGLFLLWEMAADNVGVDLEAMVLSPDAASVRTARVPLAEGIWTWQVTPTENGLALATVEVDDANTDSDADTGHVKLVEVTGRAERGKPIVLTGSPTALPDVELIKLGDARVVAWTDRRELDSVVQVASVDGGGRIRTAPKAALPMLGAQRLVDLVASGDGQRALIAWRERPTTPLGQQRVLLAPIDAAGVIGSARAEIATAHGGPPALVADGSGFAAVTLAEPELVSEYELPLLDNAAPGTTVWPGYIRLDENLGVRGGEPIRVEGFREVEGVPVAVASVTCGKSETDQGCVAVVIGPGETPPIASVPLHLRDTPWLPSARRRPDEGPPYPTALLSVYRGERLADLEATQLPGTRDAVAVMVEYKLITGPSGDDDEPQLDARVFSFGLNKDGVATEPTRLSQRASPLGGVAIASRRHDKNRVDTVAAWVEEVESVPQVVVARIRDDGTRIEKRPLTRVKRTAADGSTLGVTDVAMTQVSDGWVITWVDRRTGNAEVFAAKVDRDLNKMVSDVQVTKAGGEPADLTVLDMGGQLALAWADVRPDAEHADIFVKLIDGKTLEPVGPEERLFASTRHSSSPALGMRSDGLVAAWVEGGLSDPRANGDPPTLQVARLDKRGRVIGAPTNRAPKGYDGLTSLDLICTDDSCRAAWTGARKDQLELGLTELPVSGPARHKVVSELAGGFAATPSPNLLSSRADRVLFADDIPMGGGRVRFLSVRWGN